MLSLRICLAVVVMMVMWGCSQESETATSTAVTGGNEAAPSDPSPPQKNEAAPVAQHDTPSAQKTTLREVAPPFAGDAAEPFLFAGKNGLLLTWLQPVAGSNRFALRFARHSGQVWSTPVTIVERNDLFVNWADFPSIAEDDDGVLYVQWLQKSGEDTYSYDVRMATSTDRGLTWGEPFLLNRDGVKSEHGFASLAPLPGGGVAATWLDGRKMTAGGHGESAGDMTIRYATVDGSGAIDSDVEVDSRTCECCATGMTIAASGPVIVYRDRTAQEIRDISYVRREGKRWSEPRAVHGDGWKIDGCPVNGPQIDAAGDRVATAWFTAADEQPRVYASFSSDAAKTFDPPVVVDDGKPVGRVDLVMLDADTALVSWIEHTAGGAEIRARRIRNDGSRGPSIRIAGSSAARAAGFTRMARMPDGVWFAWTEQKDAGKRIRVARLAV